MVKWARVGQAMSGKSKLPMLLGMTAIAVLVWPLTTVLLLSDRP